jgi:UDP-glucose 4-epimerase
MNYFNKLKNKKVLVTGGLGFIGSNLCNMLIKNGANLTIIDNKLPKSGYNIFNFNKIKTKSKIYTYNFANFKKLKKIYSNQEYIFHLAGHNSHYGSMQYPFKDINENFLNFFKLLEFMKNNKIKSKIIFASTRQVYGNQNIPPVDEEGKTKPLDINGVSKLAAEQLLEIYGKNYDFNYTILRLTNIYGPRMRIKDSHQSFIGGWIGNIIRNEKIKIYDKGQQIRDFVYIDDCVNALILASLKKSTSNKIYNIGSDKFISLDNIAKLIEKECIKNNLSLKKEYIKFPKNSKKISLNNFYSEIKLFKKDTKWINGTNLHLGIFNTIKFFIKNKRYYA